MAWSAGVSSVVARDLFTRPLAPERWIGRNRVGFSCIVKIKTLECGFLLVISVVAARPFIIGMAMSMMMASGSSS